ncbi:hypothetical protein EV424DRAFT_1536362 [Suillus variegatus]|nr:hypothetical protein EV424DRAFT_1536362 [Suillus variegatus]
MQDSAHGVPPNWRAGLEFRRTICNRNILIEKNLPPFFEGIQTDLSPPVFVLRLSFIPSSGIVRDGFEEQKPGATSANSTNGSYFTPPFVVCFADDSDRGKFSQPLVLVFETYPVTSWSHSTDNRKGPPPSTLPNFIFPLHVNLRATFSLMMVPVLPCGLSPQLSIDSSRPLLHTPLQPPQITRLEKRRIVLKNVVGRWNWAHMRIHAHTAKLLSSLSDNRSEPSFNMNFMIDFHPEREDRRQHARRLSYSHAYNTFSSHAQDLFSQGFLHARVSTNIPSMFF